MVRYDINIHDYLRMLKKRQVLIVSSVVLFAAVSLFVGILRAPEALYESASAVKVERATDLTTLLLGTVSWTTWDNVATQSVIITSFPIMEKAARKLGRIPEAVSSEEVMHGKEYSSVVSGLRAQLTVEQEKNTNIINISATARDPREAQSVANTVARVYQEANSEERNRKILETKGFIEKQLKLHEQRLEESEEQLQKFKQETELVSIETQTQTMLNQLALLEAEAEQLRQKRFEIQMQMEQLQTQEATVTLGSEMTNPEKGTTFLGMLSNRVLELKLRREILLNEFTEGHPEVKAVESELKGIITTVSKELSTTSEDLNHRIANLEKSIVESRTKLLATPDNARALERLERDVAINAKLDEQLKSKYQEALIQEAGRIQEVTIVKPALEAKYPINRPMYVINAFSGALMGLVIGVVLSLFLESLDTSMTTVEELEETLHIPVLGVIPGTNGSPDKRIAESKDDQSSLIVYFAPDSSTAEAYRSLVSYFQSSRRETGSRILLMTSSSPSEGTSYNAVNLALSLAQTGDRVALIDANLRDPSLHKVFGIDREIGLTDCLWGNLDLKDSTKTIIDIMTGEFEMGDLLRAPGLDYLHIVTAGTKPSNPWGVLRSPKFKEVLQSMRDNYDTVIIDSPPILGAADTSDIASAVDGVILVYEAGRVSRNILKRAKEHMENVNARVIGVILNNIHTNGATASHQPQNQSNGSTPKSMKDIYQVTSSFGQKLKELTAKSPEKPPRILSKEPGARKGLFGVLVFLLVAAILVGLLWQNMPYLRHTFHSFFK